MQAAVYIKRIKFNWHLS